MKKSTLVLLAFTTVICFSQCKPKVAEQTNTTAATSAAEISKADIANITNREISSWEFAKTKQLDKLNNLLSDDYQAFFGKIVMSKADVIRNFQVSTITNYRLFNIKVKKIADDAAVIHYEALQNAQDQDGDKWVPNVAVSTIYAKRANVWYPVFYHETPMLKQ